MAVTNTGCIQLAKFDDCEFPSCLGPLVYIINSGFLFVCLSVTDHIWYEGGCPRAFGKLETW